MKAFNPVSRALLAFVLFLVLFAPGSLIAQTLTLKQYDHSAIRFPQEAPAGVRVIAQSGDGLLWLVSGTRLLTFDGLHVSPYESPAGEPILPSQEPMDLFAAKDGTIWLNYDDGEIAHISLGHVEVFGQADGLPHVSEQGLTQDDRGTLYTGTLEGLLELQGKKWVKVPGISQRITACFFDRLGTQWLGTNNGILYRTRGERTFQSVSTGKWRAFLFKEAPDGAIWAIMRGPLPKDGTPQVSLARLDLPGHHARELSLPLETSPDTSSSLLLIDQDGSIWVPLKSGIMRVQPAKTPPPESRTNENSPRITEEVFASKDSRTHRETYAVFEDTFGNVWIGTPSGIDRFQVSPTALLKYTEEVSQPPLIAAGQNGQVWYASIDAPLRLLDRARDRDTIRGPTAYWLSLFVDHADKLWAAGYPVRLGVAEPDAREFKDIPLPGADSASGLRTVNGVQAMAEDTRSLLVSFNGLWRYQQGRWVSVDQGALPAIGPEAMLCDHTDRVWLGYEDGQLASLKGDTIQRYTGDVGQGLAFLDSRWGILAGGAGGIAILEGDQFRRLVTNDPLTVRNVSGLLDAPNGDLWINGETGVARIASDEMQHALADSHYVIKVQSLEEGDLAGGRSIHARPSAVVDSTGRFWFSVSRYLVFQDPQGFADRHSPATTSIRDIKADGILLKPGQAAPAGTHTLSIDYLGVQLAAPEQVRYRYRLLGEDLSWRDAGTGTEAIYTGLKNGTYQFEMMASNGAGVWTGLPQPLAIKVLPFFYQTLWFKALSGIVLVSTAWLLVRLRVRIAEAELRARLSGRYGERIRIARELHDTLLQDFHGLMFQFQAGRNLIDRRPEEAMLSLDEAIADTKKALTTSRDAIQDLRSEPSAAGDLAELIKTASQELAHAGDEDNEPPKFELIEEGEPRELSPAIRDEVHRVALEILRNAYRHAGAHRIEAEIRYGNGALRLRIRDDGKGIPPEVLKEGRKPGHWGLRGIRERAERIGARVDFWSETAAGAEVQIEIPGSIAYERSPNGVWSRLLRKVRNRARYY